jgi:serine phosphatase RsbU (regulator of sigma subunit)
VAALALLFDPATARVRIAGCGELAPVLLLDGSNVALTVEIKGPWLGIFDPYPLDLFHEKIIALRKGDRLVAFTDGVSDALPHGVDQREFLFKKAKLADELVRLAPQAPLPDQVKDFCKQVQDYVRQDWPQDDTTVVIWRAPPGTG